MDRINLKKGDYVKITKIGCYGEYISYISREDVITVNCD